MKRNGTERNGTEQNGTERNHSFRTIIYTINNRINIHKKVTKWRVSKKHLKV